MYILIAKGWDFFLSVNHYSPKEKDLTSQIQIQTMPFVFHFSLRACILSSPPAPNKIIGLSEVFLIFGEVTHLRSVVWENLKNTDVPFFCYQLI